jgi:hypothetical protein
MLRGPRASGPMDGLTERVNQPVQVSLNEPVTSVLVADAGFNQCVWNSSPDWLRLAVSQSSAVTFVQDSKFSFEQEGMGGVRRKGMSVGMKEAASD